MQSAFGLVLSDSHNLELNSHTIRTWTCSVIVTIWTCTVRTGHVKVVGTDDII
jgi:hypothetical protein